MRHFYWVLALLLLPLSAYAAEGLSYSYAEFNYITNEDVDISGVGSDDDDGWNFNASFAIDDTFFVNGSYSDASIDSFGGSGVDLDLNNLSIGVGGRNPLSDMLDVYGVLSYEDFEADVSGPGGSGSLDEDGFGIAGGLRGKVTDALELNGQVKYTDVGDADGWGFKVGGLYAFAPNWGVNADYSSSDLEESGGDVDFDEFRVGLRYIF
jgi:opacity protein-like surface antigen